MSHSTSQYRDKIGSFLHPCCGKSSVFLRISEISWGGGWNVFLWPFGPEILLLPRQPPYPSCLSRSCLSTSEPFSFISKLTSFPHHHEVPVWQVLLMAWGDGENLPSGSHDYKLDIGPHVLIQASMAISTAPVPLLLGIAPSSSSFLLLSLPPVVTILSLSEIELMPSHFPSWGNSTFFHPECSFWLQAFLWGSWG